MKINPFVVSLSNYLKTNHPFFDKVKDERLVFLSTYIS